MIYKVQQFLPWLLRVHWTSSNCRVSIPLLVYATLRFPSSFFHSLCATISTLSLVLSDQPLFFRLSLSYHRSVSVGFKGLFYLFLSTLFHLDRNLIQMLAVVTAIVFDLEYNGRWFGHICFQWVSCIGLNFLPFCFCYWLLFDLKIATCCDFYSIYH